VLNAENPPQGTKQIFFTKRTYWKEEKGQDNTAEHGKIEHERGRYS
jgi:hypothetical protein